MHITKRSFVIIMVTKRIMLLSFTSLKNSTLSSLLINVNVTILVKASNEVTTKDTNICSKTDPLKKVYNNPINTNTAIAKVESQDISKNVTKDIDVRFEKRKTANTNDLL